MLVAVTYVAILSVSHQILQKNTKDNLIETVENNFNKVRFYSDIDDWDADRDTSHFIDFENGFLEVNDGFLDEVNGVYTALYRDDATLLYGENPVSAESTDLKYVDSRIQKLKADGVTYYVFDRKLTSKGLNGLWMRGVVSETQGRTQMSTIARISLVILPAIVLISSAGGYFLVRKMLRPIQKISETAEQIGRESDLKRRIELGRGSDELHKLGDTFNEMFDKLEKTFETQRQFIADASHELRTPVAVINAQCELSLEQEGSVEDYEEALTAIWKQGKKMSGLIGDMLDFTRLETGVQKYGRRTLDVSDLVRSVCEDMALVGERGITLRQEIEDAVTFTGNGELLSRLLVNLIGNAYRYGKENGHILVCLKKTGTEIELSVADDGIGIAKEEQEKIFDRFYQVDSSHSGAGTGLGLSMAQEIARFHGGRIVVESEPGKGSRFTVLFPL